MQAYQGQTRLYVIIGTMLGLMVGVFMQSFLSEDAGAARMLGLAIFAAIGALVGKLLIVAQSPETPPAPAEGAGAPQPPSATGDQETTTSRFFKASGVYSEREMQRLRVRPATMPMSPPPSEIPLQVRDYDHYARVGVIEGVLERMTVREVCERVVAEAMTKTPKTPKEVELHLVSFHSEGPLGPDGRSPLGWSFSFVDGSLGLECWATATQRDIALHFRTVATWSRPAHREWVDVDDVLKWIETALPDWDDQDIYVRVHLPDDYLAFVRNPIRIAHIDIDEGRVLNEAFLNAAEDGDKNEGFGLAELMGWFRSGEVPPDTDLARALTDPEFVQALRTLEPGALRRTGAALERRAGGRVVDAIVRAISATDDAMERNELVHLLAHVPSGLAPVALHRLAVEPVDDATAKVAAELHKRWRRGELGVRRHPLDHVSFFEARQRMGRTSLEVVPLLPTYDPEGELLPVLTGLGFEERRRRMLSGSANLLVGAQLRATGSDTELLLTSTPLPVPCHVLHVMGDDAEAVARRIRKSPIHYAHATIVADVHSDRPSRVHRAALYVAALRLDEDHLAEHLVLSAERARQNDPLRHAVVAALAVQSDPAARKYLETVAADPEDAVAADAADALTRMAPPAADPA